MNRLFRIAAVHVAVGIRRRSREQHIGAHCVQLHASRRMFRPIPDPLPADTVIPVTAVAVGSR